MSLINSAMLLGLGFAALPLLLHLLMRAKPKKLIFPALRLIQMRKKTNSRRMRLRHFWLLFLRTLLFILLVLAIARPSLPAANYGLNLTEGLTLGAILAVAAGAYWWLMRKWKQARLPNHAMRYRRSILRGGTGVGVVLLTLLAVGWPYGKRVMAEVSGKSGDVTQNVPVAAIFVFDTSQSMEYRLENKTRLEQAQELASAHLSSLPAGSRIAICDTASDRDIVFQADLISARARIDSLETAAKAVAVNNRVAPALRVQEEDRERVREELGIKGEGDGFVREIYVFADLARTGWRLNTINIKNKLEDMPWVHTYIIDVGVQKPVNCGVTSLKLSQQSATRGDQVSLEATVVSTGITEARTAELYFRDKSGEAIRQNQLRVPVEAGSGAKVSFPLLVPRNGSLQQGEVRLQSSDPFVADDVRYFTLGVNAPPRVLLVGERSLEASYLRNALDPQIPGAVLRKLFNVQYVSIRKLDSVQLSEFDAVALVNLRSPRPEHWTRFEKYVSKGGGLAVFLGRSKIDAESYNTAEAQEILPGTLLAPIKFFKGPFIVDMDNMQHPLFRRIAEANDQRAAFTNVSYQRAWSVERHGDANLLASYNNDRRSPAWLERVHNQGRTVLFTNAVDQVKDGGRDWSDFSAGPNWIFLRVVHDLVHHLSQHSNATFNWISGQDVVVRFDRTRMKEKYLLRKPGLQQLPGEVPPNDDFVLLDDTDQLGHYQFLSGSQTEGFRSGFSVNSDDRESKFEQINDEELTSIFGEDRYSRATQIEELDRAVQSTRLGREVYPLIMILVVVFFLSEHIVANYFYEADGSDSEDAPARTVAA